jgi:hypothetical protein
MGALRAAIGSFTSALPFTSPAWLAERGKKAVARAASPNPLRKVLRVVDVSLIETLLMKGESSALAKKKMEQIHISYLQTGCISFCSVDH